MAKKNKNKQRKRNTNGNKQIATPSSALVVYKSKGATPKQRQSRSSNHGANMQAVIAKQVCGIFNPFCPEAIGAKIPDLTSAKTLTACVRMLVPITTDANGLACYSFIPALSIIGSYASTITAGAIAAISGLGSVPFYSSYAANCQRYRVVSFGCKFCPSESYNTAKGVFIATEVDTSPVVGYFINSVNTSPVNIVRSVVGPPLMWISKPTDLEYTDFVDIASGAPASQRTLLTMNFLGCTASTTVGYVEFVMNVEMIAVADSIGSLFPTTAARSNPKILDMAANLSQEISPFNSGTEQSLASIIEDKLSKGFKRLGAQALEIMMEKAAVLIP